MSKLRSTYDGRLIYQTSYEERKAFLLFLLLIIIKGIYIAQVRKGHKCAMSAEMAVWLRNCLWYDSFALRSTLQ